MAAKEEKLESPPLKRRKFSGFFESNLVSNVSVFEQLEDVVFVVGNNECGIERIGGNRSLFAVQSSVFRAQLFGKMAESKSTEIVIEDVTPQAFSFLKNLFYIKEEELSVDIVLDVLYASKKYLLTDLECQCYQFIETLDSIEKWWEIMRKQRVTSDIDMEDALIRKCQILIKNSGKVALDIKNLCVVIPEWVGKLIASSSFVIEKEETVWEMCVNYCKARIASNLREDECKDTSMSEMMNKYFVKHIRFPIMDEKYFFNSIEKSGILNDTTMYYICKSIMSQRSSNLSYHYNCGYTWYPRKPYYQYFLACYDIKLLQPKDRVWVHCADGSYSEMTIEEMDWNCAETKSMFGENGVKYKGHSSCYKNFKIEYIRNCSWMACSRNAPTMTCSSQELEMFGKSCKVEHRKLNFDEEWQIGTIEEINVHATGWKTIQVRRDSDGKLRYFHGWHFDCIRPFPQ